MTDRDKKEVEQLIEHALRYDDKCREQIRAIIKAADTEKYIKKSEQWLDRMPFLLIGFVIGFVFVMILLSSHFH